MPLLLLLAKSSAIQSTQAILGASGVNSVQALVVSQGLLAVQGLNVSLADAISSIQGLKIAISDNPVQSIQELLLEVSEKDTAQALQTLLASLDEVGSSLQDVDWNIYLDGRSIKGQVVSAAVTYDEGSVHNQFSCTSIDRNLFWRADPYDLSGESRIEVHIGARVLYFLLEDKNGTEVEFELWGRSISARDDEPHSDGLDFALSSPMSARTAAESMLIYNVVNWDIPDWTLPSDFEFNGSRIAGVQEIANIIGAVVRSEDDGSLTVRRLWPIRPVNMPTSTPDISYDRFENIIQLRYEVQKGDGFNEVNVFGKGADLIMPELYLKEDNPCVGDEVHIQAYWKSEIPSIVETFVTSGIMQAIGSSFETITETVVFESGRGNTKKPIYDITAYGWIGSNGGALSFTQYESELICETTYGVADVIYRSKYQTYRISGSAVKLLLAALIVEGTPGNSIKVKMLDGGKAAPPIENKNLTSDPIALEAGQAFLDGSCYDQTVLRLRVPYNAEAVDGAIASVTNQEIGISGNYKIRKSELKFNGPQVVQEIEVSQCRLS